MRSTKSEEKSPGRGHAGSESLPDTSLTYDEARAKLASLDVTAKRARAVLDETSRPLLWLGVIFLVGGLILLFADLIDSKGETVTTTSLQAGTGVVATTVPPADGTVGETKALPLRSTVTSSSTLHDTNDPSFFSRNVRYDVLYGVGVAGTALAVLVVFIVLLIRSIKERGAEGVRHRDPWYWLSLLLFIWWIPLGAGMFVGILAGLMLIVPAIRLYSWEMAAAGIGSSIAFALFLVLGSGTFSGFVSPPYFVTGAILFGTGLYLRRAM